jgi:hypothetical protein
MSNRQRILALAAGAVALAGCGGHGSKGAASEARVTATETEFKIQLSQQSFNPGTYTFVALNKGTTPHSLEISGPGVSNRRVGGTIAPNQSKTLTVALQKGIYDVFCPVPGHKQEGMDVKINVGGASGGAGGGTTTTSGGGYGY